MLDPELKQEFSKINEEFAKIHTRFDIVEDSIESLARSTAEGFEETDEHFDRLGHKLQSQVDGIAERKVDRSEFAPIKAQVLNLQRT